MKKYLLSTVAAFMVLVGISAKANYFDFAVVAVAPGWGVKRVAVDVYGVGAYCPWGWKQFSIGIDGYAYPITTWNALPTSPNSVRAFFDIPGNWLGWHQLQLAAQCWTQAYYGTLVPVQTYYSFPKAYLF